MTATAPAATRFTDHFATLAPRYDLLLCDIWGVVHNGVTAFAPACEALVRFRDQGDRAVVLVTNAPRPHDSVKRQLDQLGVPEAAYDAIVTSGDITRDAIAARPGQAVFHLGPERDRPVFKGFDIRYAPAGQADYVVCTGLFDDTTETPDDYRETLETMRARGLTMVCANPDKVVARGDDLVYCAGALADLYREMGGEVRDAGKPHRPIYDAAFAKAAAQSGRQTPPERILAIGDSVRTDLSGAHALGLDCLFIASGIHAEEIAGNGDAGVALARTFAEAGMTPQATMHALAW
ncbi:MAG TPA: TIGR01459 family HAD-type hydrolase [Xanthobacteraceae bacterium]|nr:TIGR01459 family HAD-type hydrolase [Xanthobacteraceae bacterium]